MGLQPGNDQIGHPIKETRQMEMSHDKYHGKEQHNSSEVDEIQRVVCKHGARSEHQNCADDGSTRSINPHSWKFSESEYDVTGNEN